MGSGYGKNLSMGKKMGMASWLEFMSTGPRVLLTPKYYVAKSQALWVLGLSIRQATPACKKEKQQQQTFI